MRRTGRIRFRPRGRLGARERDDLQRLRECASERTCRSYQVLVRELESLVCRSPLFGCVVCLPTGPQPTITPLAVLLTDATWYGVPFQTPTTSMSLGILAR